MDSKRNLSREELELMVVVLNSTLRCLRTGPRDFVCNIIEGVYYDDAPLGMRLQYRFATDYLVSWVRKMLDGYTTLDHWLYAKYGLPSLGDAADNKLRGTRILWVEWMIQQLQSEFKNAN